ncbi:MAG: LuxR C-terminal-related transcriptional regulator [Pyrinomonadaceae bacterium]
MRIGDIEKLVEGTADAAYALAPDGVIVAWNNGAAGLFGVSSKEAVGKQCFEILRGVDECGSACGSDCTVREHSKKREPISSYDICFSSAGKQQWCNISVMIVDEVRSETPYTVHLVRPIDKQKRFERLMMDFIKEESGLPIYPSKPGIEVRHVPNSPTAMTDLTRRETEILQCIASGMTSKKMAEKMFISPTTVNNHVQNLLKKLNAHSRLEAVRMAEKAGLI